MNARVLSLASLHGVPVCVGLLASVCRHSLVSVRCPAVLHLNEACASFESERKGAPLSFVC